MNKKSGFSNYSIPLLGIFLFSLVGGLFGLMNEEEVNQIHDKGYHGALILKPSEKGQIRDIRDKTDVLILIPETKEIHGTSTNLERDGKLIREITGEWYER